MIYMAIQGQKKILMHFKKQAQVGALLFDKAITKVPAEYFNYSNIFSAENAAKLLKNTRIIKNAIKLKESKELFFGPIFSLGSIELKTLKTYIKIILANGFIQPFKSPIGAPILFNKKLDKTLHLCIDYWSINNITIKN